MSEEEAASLPQYEFWWAAKHDPEIRYRGSMRLSELDGSFQAMAVFLTENPHITKIRWTSNDGSRCQLVQLRG